MEQGIAIGLLWKLRRVAADLRQQDVAAAVGISTTRYSGLERGYFLPTKLEERLLGKFLPPLPESLSRSRSNSGCDNVAV